MTFRPTPPLVLGFHATSRGFGWVVFQGPGTLLDWGIAFITSGDKNTKSAQQAEGLLQRFRPDILAFERFDQRTGKRAHRMVQLHQRIAEIADGLSVQVERYGGSDIRNALGLPASATRHGVALRVSEHIEAIRHRLPPERKAWDGSDRRMALFNAAALALTAYTGLD